MDSSMWGNAQNFRDSSISGFMLAPPPQLSQVCLIHERARIQIIRVCAMGACKYSNLVTNSLDPKVL